jgi:hypothetical protein
MAYSRFPFLQAFYQFGQELVQFGLLTLRQLFCFIGLTSISVLSEDDSKSTTKAAHECRPINRINRTVVVTFSLFAIDIREKQSVGLRLRRRRAVFKATPYSKKLLWLSVIRKYASADAARPSCSRRRRK